MIKQLKTEKNEDNREYREYREKRTFDPALSAVIRPYERKNDLSPSLPNSLLPSPPSPCPSSLPRCTCFWNRVPQHRGDRGAAAGRSHGLERVCAAYLVGPDAQDVLAPWADTWERMPTALAALLALAAGKGLAPERWNAGAGGAAARAARDERNRLLFASPEIESLAPNVT